MKSERGSTLLIVLLSITILLTLGLSILSASIGGSKRTAYREEEINQTINIQFALNTYMAAIYEKVKDIDLSTVPTSTIDLSLSNLYQDVLNNDPMLQPLKSDYSFLFPQDITDTTIHNSKFDRNKQYTRAFKVTVKPVTGSKSIERTISQQFILSPTPSFLDFALGSEDGDLILNGSPDIIGNIYADTIKISNEARFKVNNKEFVTGKYANPYIFGTIYGDKFIKIDKDNRETKKVEYPDILDNENEPDGNKHFFYGEVYNPENHYKAEVKPTAAYNFVGMNFKGTFKQKLLNLDGISNQVGINDQMETYSEKIIQNICWNVTNETHSPDDDPALFNTKISNDTYIELLSKQGKLENGDLGILKMDFDALSSLVDNPAISDDEYDVKMEQIFEKMKALDTAFNNKQTELATELGTVENNPLIPCDTSNNIYLLENDFYNGIVESTGYTKWWETNIPQYNTNKPKIVVFADITTDGGQISSIGTPSAYANGDGGIKSDSKPPTLVLNDGIDLDDNGWLIVLGDLVINTENPNVQINGNILVTGNLTIQGVEKTLNPSAANHVAFDSTIYVYGCDKIEQGSNDNNCGKPGSETKVYNTTITGIDPINDQLVLIANNPFSLSRIDEFRKIISPESDLKNRLEKDPSIKAFFYTDKSAVLYGVGSLFDIKGGVFAKQQLTINAIREHSLDPYNAITGLPEYDISTFNSPTPLNEERNSRFFVNFDYTVIINQLDALPLVDRLQMIVEKPIFE